MTDNNDRRSDDAPKPRFRKKAPPSRASAAYDVGKGKPPIQHQFRKGGKPGPGRPRGSPNKSDLDNVLDELILVGEDRLGRPIRKSGRRVANIQLRNLAVKGDLRAMTIIKDHEERMAAINARRGDAPPTEQEIRKRLEEEKQRKATSERLMGLLELATDLRRNGLSSSTDGEPRLAPFIYEALRDYREKLGWSRNPGVGEPWNRDACDHENL